MKKRTRVSSDLVTKTWTFRSPSDGKDYHMGGRSHFSRYSSIVDWAGKKRISKGRMVGKYPASACEHIHVQHVGTWPSPTLRGGSVSAVRMFQPALVPMGFAPVAFSQYLKAYTTAAVNALAHQSFMDLSEQMPEEISLANFIIELRDLGSLLPKLHASLSRTVSEGLLSFSFGSAPFIGDLIKLTDIANQIQARLTFLRESRGKLVRISTTYSPVWEPPVIPSRLTHFHGNDFDCYTHADIRSYTSQFRASGLLYHELRGLDGLESSLRGLFGALGFGNPLRVAWNAIPFSFIVDWIGDISGQLRKLRMQPFNGPWEVHNFTWTLKDHAQFDLTFQHKEQYLTPYGTREVYRPAGQIVVKRFIRGVGLPSTPGGLSLPLSAKQFALLTALSRTRSVI